MRVKKYKGYTFVDDVQDVSLSEYKDAKKYFQQEFKKLDESIYIQEQQKKKGFSPSFSDIDYVGISNSPSEQLKNLLHIDNQEGIPKYVLYHDGMIVSKKTAHECGSIVGQTKADWIHVAGPKIKVTQPTKKSIDFRTWEDLCIHNVREIFTPLLTKKIRCRSIGHKLNTLQYSFPKTIRSKIDLKTDIKSYRQEVNELRKNWFSQGFEENAEQIIDLLDQAKQIILEGTQKIEPYLKEKYIKISPKQGAWIQDRNFPVLFTNKQNPEELMKELYEKSKKVIPVLPQSYQVLFDAYSKQDGILGKHLSKMVKHATGELKEKSHVQRRIKFYNNYIEFCKQHKIEYGPLLHFDLHQPPQKIRHKIKSIVLNKIWKHRAKSLFVTERL